MGDFITKYINEGKLESSSDIPVHIKEYLENAPKENLTILIGVGPDEKEINENKIFPIFENKFQDSEINESEEINEKELKNIEPLIILKESIKYSISSVFLPHKFEIFQTKYEEFFSMVSKFHLPCVRAYYTGENVYILPSA